MKQRKRFFSLVLCLCCCVSLLCFSAVEVSAAEYTIEDGWVVLKTIDSIGVFWGSKDTGDGGWEYYNDAAIKWGVSKTLSGVALNEAYIYIDILDDEGKVVSVPSGYTLQIQTVYKSSYKPYMSASWTAIPRDLISFEAVYSDNIADRLQSTENLIDYTYTNSTGSAVDLSYISIGMIEAETTLDSVYSIAAQIDSFKYRVLSPDEVASGAIGDKIDQSKEEIKDKLEEENEELKDKIEDKVDEQIENDNKNTGEIKDKIDEQTEEQKGMFERLGDRIKGFFDSLLEGIKGFFIPEDGYFDQYFDDWNTWMTDHFGALYYPFDLILDVLNRFLTLQVPETPTITFPAIQVGETVLLEQQQYTFFGDDSLPALNGLYTTYRTVVTAIFVFLLANLAWKKLNSIMGGGE